MQKPTEQSDTTPVVVLGGGPAGLGAAYLLAKAGTPVLLLEKEPRVGGMGASIKVKDYIADYGPHTFHLKDSVVTRLFEELVGPNVNKVARNAKIWLHGKTMPFPLRMSDALTKLSPWLSFRIVSDFLIQQALGVIRKREPTSFEEWGVRQFGRTLYKLAFGNYSEKMWGLSGRELSVKLAKQKLTGLSLMKLILATLGLLNQKKADAIGLGKVNLYDAYPRFGIGTFFEALARQIEADGGVVQLQAKVLDVRLEGNRVVEVVYQGADNREVRQSCRDLISTIPLPSLVPLLRGEDFDSAATAASRLQYRSLICVHLILDRDTFSEAHWTYLLDQRLTSNRLSEQKHLCQDSCPPGKTMVTLDITCNYGDYLWQAEDSFLIGLGIHDLQVMGLHPRTILDAFVLRAPHVYPIYNRGFEKDMEVILGRFRRCENLYSVGRHGLLLNNDMHDSIEMGFFSAQTILDGRNAASWYDIADAYVRERLEGIVRDPIKFNFNKK